MLVVSRKIGERIFIGEKIVVTVVKISSGGVRIGIDAPTEMPIVREELAEKLQEAERQILKASQSSGIETDRVG